VKWIAILLLAACTLPSVCVAESVQQKWSRLSKLNDPPNKVSVRAALTATQNMSVSELCERLTRYQTALLIGRLADPASKSVLRREIALLTTSMETHYENSSKRHHSLVIWRSPWNGCNDVGYRLFLSMPNGHGM
jgi:hypothetical protein